MPVMTGSVLQNLSYNDLISWVNMSGADVDAYISAANQYGISDMQAIEDLAAGYMNYYKNGDGTYTILSFTDDFQQTATSAIDSNVSTVSRGGIKQMLNRGVNSVTGKLNITKFPVNGSFTSQASYVLGSVGSGVAAVSTGISLGKFIDSSLYNLNPNFWDSHGMSSLNPETWNSITNGDDSNFAGLFNLILGLDPETGNSQAYMDENAFAYMAYYMAQQGVFSPAGYTTSQSVAISNFPEGISLSNPNFVYDVHVDTSTYGLVYNRTSPRWIRTNSSTGTVLFTNCYLSGLSSSSTTIAVSDSPFSVTCAETIVNGATTTTTVNATYNQSIGLYTASSGLLSYRKVEGTSDMTTNLIPEPTTIVTGSSNTGALTDIALIAWYGSVENVPIEGISNQPNATLPDVSSWNDIPSTLNSLKQQYPDLWNDALTWDNVQPDGSNPQLTYIPVGLPNAVSNIDTQPTTGTQTQSSTSIDTDTLRKLLTEIATQPATATDSSTTIPPENPVDTGTGDSPTPVSPSGSASALWSVYHPTQTQINSFGAWLWGSPFLTDIGKLFENPIDGVISLHKIYATPVDSGTGTIVVGTLDSNVSSATVTQQYVNVDCGYVDCHEEFGNVFDYPPFTKVSLYLPFIGIVDLDTDDVMRSTIHVIYGVDVFTGACLAMVEVTRDSNTVNLYQYAGVCAVSYPLGNVQQSQLFSGLLAIAGGVAATVASGGIGAPAALAIAGGAGAAAKSSIGRSGGFSGNAGAMGIKKPYLILQRPQTKVAETFPRLSGYPTNISGKLSDFSGQVNVTSVHVEGINATDSELKEIESLLKSGVLV